MKKKRLDDIELGAKDVLKNPNPDFYYDNPGAAGEEVEYLNQIIIELIDFIKSGKPLIP